MAALPAFVAPMLAKLRKQPFDSDAHLFEPKWDGFRAITFVEEGGHRVRSRRDRDLAPRFPEVEAVRVFPAGTVLDGEIVVLEDGRPDFESMLRREQARELRSIERFVRELPASYVVFDLLYVDGRPILDEPLTTRRRLLAALFEGLGDGADHRLLLSEGSVGGGVELYERSVELGMEGVVGKRLDSPYLPGQRTDLWTKVKVPLHRHCVVLGYLRNEAGDLRSLVVGTDVEGELRCVGRVGSGLSEGDRRALLPRLRGLRREEPVVDCSSALDGNPEWVEPGIFCTVSFLEFTSGGTLRAPVFEGLVEDGE